ncbi:glycosyltransferase family 4 protein [Halomonas sp. PGE1]|uniref:glycosyltransferase family 4 protein n=1 Tax=Halomonas sp. PGE1 TaxID=2730360 RepID=UPI001475DD51|nr:glycosyltransferase family 4 protein [Halomonas sp. PGE1]QJQ99358.1 glycosyltransferase family 4 protein [Halomonas sp. PGE1]
MNKKTVWIINQDASTPETGYAGRSYYLSQALSRKGHNVKLVVASYHHLMHSPPECSGLYSEEVRDGFQIIWVKVGRYKDASSKGRVLNWFRFAWLLRGLVGQFGEKPDSVIYSSPSLLGYVGAEYLSRKTGARLIFDVRDIWPLTLVHLGGYSIHHPFIKLLQWIEDRAYKNSDIVISNLSNSVEHMCARGMDRKKFHWVPNGFSLDEVSFPSPLSIDIKDQIPKSGFVVGYAGSVGLANANNILLEAAKALKSYGDIYFVIVGDGAEKKILSEFARKEKLSNVIFIDSIPKKQIQSLLSFFSCCYFGVRDEPIYQFGIGANKIPEYMFSGRPVVMSYSGRGDPVSKAGSGIVVPAGDHLNLADAILTLYSLSDNEMAEMGECGKKFATENFDYDCIASQLEELL